MREEGATTCVCVYPVSSRVTAAQLDLVLMEEEGRRKAAVNPRNQHNVCQGVKMSGMCDEGCMCAFTCVCELT